MSLMLVLALVLLTLFDAAEWALFIVILYLAFL